MAVIAEDSTRFSAVVKNEFEPASGYCRDVVTINDAAATLRVGAVLGKYIEDPEGAATAGTNTGDGTMGTITMTSKANLKLGTYTLRISKAAANAGDFTLSDPDGDVVGNGTVAVAFAAGGFSFTLADGATDFVVGDTFTIVVSGTEKYKLVEATATDGSQVASTVLIADSLGLSRDIALTVDTDTTVLVLSRGPAIVADAALQFGASVNTDAEKEAAYAQLKAVGILVETAV